jgi:hypothetical protein
MLRTLSVLGVRESRDLVPQGGMMLSFLIATPGWNHNRKMPGISARTGRYFIRIGEAEVGLFPTAAKLVRLLVDEWLVAGRNLSFFRRRSRCWWPLSPR